MSDDWIVLVSQNPHYVPTTLQQNLAQERFSQIAPSAHEIQLVFSDYVQFFDSGTNFERIVCTLCGCEIPISWWQFRMEEDFDGYGYKLNQYTTPCCHKSCSLHSLIYDWPQGFGKFAISAMNPNLGMLDRVFVSEFEEILGTPLRVVYQHI